MNIGFVTGAPLIVATAPVAAAAVTAATAAAAAEIRLLQQLQQKLKLQNAILEHIWASGGQHVVSHNF